MFLEKEREEFLKLFCLWRRLRGGRGGGADNLPLGTGG